MREERPASRCYEMRLLAMELEANEAYRVHADVLRHAAAEIESLTHRLAEATVRNTHCKHLHEITTIENAKLQKLVQRMWPVFTGEKRATFADRLRVKAEIDELGIKVK